MHLSKNVNNNSVKSINYWLLTNEKWDVKESSCPGVLVGTLGELFIKSVISKSKTLNTISHYLLVLTVIFIKTQLYLDEL